MAEGIVNKIREWLFGPAEEVPCQNCEILKEQLAFANYDRKMLLEHFVRAAMPEKTETAPINIENLAPIRTHGKPWRVRQQELERESRQRASLSRKVTPQSIEKLETELGVNHAATGQAVQEDGRQG